MMLAQSIDAIPSNFWKHFCMAMLVLLGVAGVAALIWNSLRKPDKTKLDDDPAINVRKAQPRFNFALAENRHGEVVRRLDGHDAEFEALWTTMRKEDSAIRDENSKKFEAIMLSLGRIEGRLNK